MEAPSPGMFVYTMQMRQHLWIQHCQCRFGPEQGKTGRGQLTGLDMQIKTPVYVGEAEKGGWGGAASVSKKEGHLLTLQLGQDSLPSMASWQTGCWCERQKVVRWTWWQACPVYSSAQRPPCDHILLIRLRAKPSAGIWESSFMLSAELKMWRNQACCLVY